MKTLLCSLLVILSFSGMAYAGPCSTFDKQVQKQAKAAYAACLTTKKSASACKTVEFLGDTHPKIVQALKAVSSPVSLKRLPWNHQKSGQVRSTRQNWYSLTASNRPTGRLVIDKIGGNATVKVQVCVARNIGNRVFKSKLVGTHTVSGKKVIPLTHIRGTYLGVRVIGKKALKLFKYTIKAVK